MKLNSLSPFVVDLFMFMGEDGEIINFLCRM
jgi:hypothetical protein